MPAEPPKPPPSDLLRERLPRFFDAWREQTRLADPRPLTEAHEVALALVARGDLESDDGTPESILADHLHPVLVKTPEDDALFRDLWKRYVGETETRPKEILTDTSMEQSGNVSGARRLGSFRSRWLVVFPIVALLVGGGFWLWPIFFAKPPVEPVVETSPPPAPDPGKAPELPPAPKPVEPVGDPNDPFILPDNFVDWSVKPEVVPFLREVPWWETLLTSPWTFYPLVAALIALVVFILVVWQRAWFSDQVNYLTRNLGKSGQRGKSEQFFLGLKREGWDASGLLTGVVSRLRRHQEEETGRIDSRRTIRVSIRKGGYFTPVHAKRPETPQYLFLVEERHRHDHLGRMLTQWIAALRNHGVSVDEFRFQDSPEQAYQAPEQEDITLAPDFVPQLVPLRDLSVRYARHRLVLFGQDLEPSDPYTGEAEPWAELLDQWETHRAILTPPGSHGDLGLGQLRERGWTIFDFSETGVRALGLWVAGEGIPGSAQNGSKPPGTFADDVDLWLGSVPPSPGRLDSAVAELETWLEPEGMRWLRSCAVFPLVDWHLTAYLGDGLRKLRSPGHPACATKSPATPSAPLTQGTGRETHATPEDTLWKMSQLPWLREARMPEWFRQRLLADLHPDDRDATGALIYLALRQDKLGGEEHAVEVIAQKPKLIRRLSQRLWRRLIKKYPELRDELALTSVGGASKFRLPPWISASLNWAWPIGLAILTAGGIWMGWQGFGNGDLDGREPVKARPMGEIVSSRTAEKDEFVFVPPGRVDGEEIEFPFWIARKAVDLEGAAPQAYVKERLEREWGNGSLSPGWIYAEPSASEKAHATRRDSVKVQSVTKPEPDLLHE